LGGSAPNALPRGYGPGANATSFLSKGCQLQKTSGTYALVKMAKNIMSIYLAVLHNSSISHGVLPEKWPKWFHCSNQLPD